MIVVREFRNNLDHVTESEGMSFSALHKTPPFIVSRPHVLLLCTVNLYDKSQSMSFGQLLILT